MDDTDSYICKDSGSELIILGALISLSIGHNLTAYEQNLFGNLLQVIGQNLSLLSIKKGNCINNYINCIEKNSNNNYTTDIGTNKNSMD